MRPRPSCPNIIDAVERGERVVICKRNHPVAELRRCRTEADGAAAARGREGHRHSAVVFRSDAGRLPRRVRVRACVSAGEAHQVRRAWRRRRPTYRAHLTPQAIAMKLLLDTCTFLWVAERPTAAPAARGRPGAQPREQVFFSAASAWEIAIKYAAGRLTLAGTSGAVRSSDARRTRHRRACHRRRIGAPRLAAPGAPSRSVRSAAGQPGDRARHDDSHARSDRRAVSGADDVVTA